MQVILNLRILHITPAYYPATYWGGPIYSTYGLCNALSSNPNISIIVLTTDTAGPKMINKVAVTDFPMIYPGGYKVYFCHRLWASSFSPGMLLRLWSMIKCADVVHLTAVYSSPTIPTLMICRILGKPIVWSPRGALQRWKRTTNPFAKKVWESICNVMIKPSNCILHVTSEIEAISSSERITNAEIKVIPNGVDIPEILPERTWRPEGRLRLLYLGRLHPIKGIENLLYALKQLDNEHISLAIYGTGDACYCHSLHEMVNKLGLTGDVLFKGHLDSKDKITAFMSSDVCVVPSYSENFGMIIAESLAHGVPVIASKGTPWEMIEKIGCGYWVENDHDTLALCIQNTFNDDLKYMGEQGQVWVRENLQWDRIAEEMANVYQRILNNKSRAGN